MRPLTRLSISQKLVTIYLLSHVHILVARIDRRLVVDSWLLLNVDRLLSDSAHLVLFDGNDARRALHLHETVAVEIDAGGDQSNNEEDPLNGAERSSGFGRIYWAIGGPDAVRSVNTTTPIPGRSQGGERAPGREPEHDAEALEDDMRIFVIGDRVPECGDLDVADGDESPDEGEDGEAIAI
jgi:hypothetical protein